MDYKDKYLKYKFKYFNLKNQYGGNNNYPLTLSSKPSNDNKTIQIGKIQDIGGGEFGLVFTAELSDESLKNKSCKHIAFKTIRFGNEGAIEELTRELEIFNKIQTAKDKCPSNTSNISNSYGGFKLPEGKNYATIGPYITIPYCIVMEYCEFGTLKRNNLNNDEKLLILRDAAKGIDQLHKLNFVHRDIAARNILICYNKSCNKSGDNMIGKITDFGLTREMINGSYIQTKSVKLPIKYLSPSIFKNTIFFTTFTKFTDWWSFGCTIYETLVDILYKDITSQEVLQIIKKKNFNSEIFFNHNSESDNNFKEFIKGILDNSLIQSQYQTLTELFDEKIKLLTNININIKREENYDETLSNYFNGKNK